MDIIERDIYALIASGDGIKAREIAKKLNKDRIMDNLEQLIDSDEEARYQDEQELQGK